MAIKYLDKALLVLGLVLVSASSCSNNLEQQRNAFLQAQKFLRQGDTQAFLALSSTLTAYPLYPYLQYQWLKGNLQRTDQIRSFLSTYKDSHYAGLLRAKWLDYLAQQERWQEFRQYYEASDNVARECQFYWAHYKLGNKQLALTEARRLWAVGEVPPKACAPLLAALMMSPEFSNDLIWQRFELALNNGNITVADYARRLLNKSEQQIAEIWLQVHKTPSLIQDSGFGMGGGRQMGRIFAHGVERMSRSDLDLAIAVWDERKKLLAIDPQIEQQIDRKLALALAYKHDKRAYNRLSQLPADDEKVRAWRIRAALQEQNWPHVVQALDSLTAEERQEPGWRYWFARAQEAVGNSVLAQSLYAQLAEDRSFYGFLAADKINRGYSLNDNPAIFTQDQLAELEAEADFKVVQEFKFFNLELEVRRQWLFAIKKLTKERLMIAAKLAQQWQWDQLAIITLAKAEYWDDLALRFPVRYTSQVSGSAYRLNIDPAIILGLIRQESMLDSHARSAVGARGLMQLMPETGRQMAGKLGEPWQSEASLFNPDINIRYGSTYYKQLLDRFNGHFVLATAAYNAGPNRTAKWLPVEQAIPADVWIETIPYEETRKYVIAVLSYALIYQYRLQGHALKIKNLLVDVKSTKN